MRILQWPPIDFIAVRMTTVPVRRFSCDTNILFAVTNPDDANHEAAYDFVLAHGENTDLAVDDGAPRAHFLNCVSKTGRS